MALDALHTGCGGVLLELGFEFFVFFLHHEADVHQRAVFFLCRAAEEFVAVDFAVEQFGASLGAAFHFFHAALRLDPFQILQGAVDGHNGRGVEHRAFIDVRAIVEHRGNGAAHLAEQFFFYNHEGNARHREVLLRTAVNQAIFCHVEGTREDVGRHVGHEGHRAIEVAAEFCAVNGIVGRDVEIIRIGGDVVVFGNEGVVSVGGRCHFYHFAEELSLFEGFLGPYAGVEICGFLFEEVEGHHAELRAGTAAEEEHGIAFGYAEEFFEEVLRLVDDSLEFFGTVADFHEGKPHALKFHTGVSRCFHHFLREN